MPVTSTEVTCHRGRTGGQGWLFTRHDTAEAAWRVVAPILGDAVPVQPNAAGSGDPPKDAEALLRAGEAWHDPVDRQACIRAG
jgi:glucose-6-phosphate 1-dehydrogenase